MADTIFPTPGFRWPEGAVGTPIIIPPFYAEGDGPGVIKVHEAAIDQIRRDRDELLAALEEANQRCHCDVQSLYASLCPGCLSAAQLIARIKAGK